VHQYIHQDQSTAKENEKRFTRIKDNYNNKLF
jgi:hypothetical protein